MNMQEALAQWTPELRAKLVRYLNRELAMQQAQHDDFNDMMKGWMVLAGIPQDLIDRNAMALQRLLLFQVVAQDLSNEQVLELARRES